MRFLKSDIAGKLAMLKKVIPSKPSIECMKGILVRDGMLTANNLTTALRTSVDFADDEHFIIPMRAIEMIESMPEGEIEVSLDKEDSLVIKSGNIKNRISTYPADTFPEVDTIDSAASVKIESKKLQSLVQSIMYAVPTNNIKPVMTGLLFDADGQQLNLVACDGYRIAWATLPYETEFKMVVPRAAVQTLLTLGLDGDIGIRYTQQRAAFDLDEYTFFCRLLDGEYFNYRQAYPTYKNSVIIERRPLIECIRRAVICLEDKGRPLAILDLAGDKLSISTRSSIGEYSETLEVDPPADKEVKIGFNARYLKDCFDSYTGPSLECFFGGSHAPMVVDDGDVKSLVLPVRLSKEDGGE